MSPRDETALALYQLTRHEPRAVAAALLDQFFNFPSQDDFERDLDVIRECMERKS
jgi:hypothetical protein